MICISHMEATEMLSLQEAFVPFMQLARWLCDENEAYFCAWKDREKPLLKGGRADESE